MTRVLERIIATTDVHSHLGAARNLLAHLYAERSRSLVADCGDFFEGTGYYRLGGGSTERQILTSLYDVLAPGNHGWSHHFEPGLRELTVCANAVDDSGTPLFRRLHLARVAGRMVAVTAVISPQAFAAIPVAERAGHYVIEPARALAELMLTHHHGVDGWVVLSHSGFEQDLKLADDCPFLDIVFAGHCHSDRYGPETVGHTLIVKGAELAAGYAHAAPAGRGWEARVRRFPTAESLPEELHPIDRQIIALEQRLSDRLGPVADRWRGRVPDRREVLTEAAGRLHASHGTAVILNDTALRPQGTLGEVLRRGDLLAIEPFGNRLAHVSFPETAELPGVLAALTGRAGPLVLAPDPLPPDLRGVLTTEYLAQTVPGGLVRLTGVRLGQVVQDVLTAPLRAAEQGEPR